jgi:hypothetical protein
MKKNDMGCYEPEVKFIVDHLVLYDTYPFRDLSTQTPYHKNALRFLSSVKHKYDIYDKVKRESTLQIGGFLHGVEQTMQEFERYKKILKQEEEINGFDALLLTLLEKSLQTHLPIESFSEFKEVYETLRKNNKSTYNKNKLFDFVYEHYMYNLKQSTVHLNRLMQIEKEIRVSGGSVEQKREWMQNKDVLVMSSHLYYMKSECILSLVKYYIRNKSLWNKWMASFDILKSKYEEFILSHKRKMDEEIDILQSKNISFNEMKSMEILKKKYWKEFQTKIRFMLYFPFEYNDSLFFLALTPLLFEQNFSYESVEQFSTGNKRVICTYQMKNIEWRVLTRPCVKMIQEMKSISVLRFFLYKLMSNKEFYEEHTKIAKMSKIAKMMEMYSELSIQKKFLPQSVSFCQIKKLLS